MLAEIFGGTWCRVSPWWSCQRPVLQPFHNLNALRPSSKVNAIQLDQLLTPET